MTDWFEVRMPRTLKWQPQLNATFMQALFEHIVSWLDLEVVCTHQQISWIAASGDENALSLETMQTLVSSYFPSGEVVVPDGWGSEMPYYRRSVVLARSDAHFYETFASVLMQEGQDPFATMVQTLDHLEPDEVLTYHVYISGMQHHTQEEIFELLTISAYDAGYRYQINAAYRLDLSEFAGALIGKRIQDNRLKKERVWRHEERDIQRYAAKLGQKLAEVNVYVRFDSPHQERLQSLSNTIAAIKNMTMEGRSCLVDGVDRSGRVCTEDESNALWPGSIIYDYLTADDETQAARIFQREPILLLTADEVASLWHLPHEQFTATRILWTQANVPLPQALKEVPDGIVIGHNNGHVVKLPAEEETMHTVVSGKNGTGKSSVVQQMVAEYLALERGVCVVDPHGQLVANILRYHIPAGREDDVVILDFSNQDYPAPLNPLSRPDAVSGDIATDRVMAVMTRVYDDFAFHEMADTLHMALMTLAADREATLLDIQRLFDDAGYRNRLVARIDDFPVTAFWNKFETLNLSKQNEMTRPVLRRLNAFYRNKALRAIACHPKPLNLRQLVSENKIILISLEADEARMPSEQRELLGAVLVSQIQMAAMAGAIQAGPFMLFIDEAQHFVTTSLDTMLSEARKQGLGLVLANQYLKQLSGSTLEAVEGNVATLITFEVGESDAHALSPYMKPEFQVEDLVKLGKYRAAVSTRCQNVRQPAFTLETYMPPQANGAIDHAAARAREAFLRRKSIENYTPMTYDEVNDWLRDRYLSTPTTVTANEAGDEFIEQSPRA